MYYRNLLWAEAIDQLRLAVDGGIAPEGGAVEGIPLSNDVRVAEYYYTYSLALARTGQCGDGLQIAQEIQAKVPADENAQFAASETIRICEENLVNPQITTSTPAAGATLSGGTPPAVSTP
jgi:hypothetical protein